MSKKNSLQIKLIGLTKDVKQSFRAGRISKEEKEDLLQKLKTCFTGLSLPTPPYGQIEIIVSDISVKTVGDKS